MRIFTARAAPLALALCVLACAGPSTTSVQPPVPTRAQSAVPDPAIGPNALDETRHAGQAVTLPPATSVPVPLPISAGRLGIAAAAPAPFHREVFGFAPYWSLSVESTWNYRLLTTLSYFGMTLTRDATFDTTVAGYSQFYSQNFVDMVNRAHAAGDRVVVTIKQFNTEAINRVVTDPALTQLAINNTIALMQSKNLDGVNVDFEGQTSSTYPYLQSGLTTFMGKLSQAVHAVSPSDEVSIDTYTGSASWDGGIFKIGDLAPVVDAFFIMAYDMSFSDTPGEAGANAPMTYFTYNDTLAVSQYLSKAPASKILLGVPYYGYKWSTSGNSPNSTVNPSQPSAIADTYSNTVGEVACPAKYKTLGWDSRAESPYMIWYSPSTNDPCGENVGSWRELYYDSATSLGLKYDLVNQSNLRGAGMWALGYDGGATELWNEIAQKLTTVTTWDTLNGQSISDPAAAVSTATRMDVFMRGTDGAAWHDSWDGTQWQPWDSLGGVITSAPAAVAPGGTRVDMFARGADNGLWHRSWNGTQWSSWDSVGGNLTSGPDAASWSATRMDVFVRGTDMHLWHRVWNGTQWLAWESLGGVLASDPAAVAYTNGRLDVFVKGSDGALWHRAYDTGGWGSWESLGGSLVSAPAAASCGMFNLEVFAVQSDRALWHLGWNQYGWGTWQPEGGQWAGGPAATCLPGASNVDVFERAQDGTIWHSSIPA